MPRRLHWQLLWRLSDIRPGVKRVRDLAPHYRWSFWMILLQNCPSTMQFKHSHEQFSKINYRRKLFIDITLHLTHLSLINSALQLHSIVFM